MSEQRPGGSNEAQQDYSLYPQAYIDVCIEEDGKFEFALGAVSTSRPSELYAEDKQAINDTVGRMLSQYGISPDTWVDQVEHLKGNDRKEVSGKRIRAKGEQRPVGTFLHDMTWWHMPMEGEYDGSGIALLTLRLSDTHTLELTGEGQYGRKRFYKDPETGETPNLPVDDPSYDFTPDEDDPDYLGYLDWHTMTFTGKIVPREAKEDAPN